MNIVVRNSPNQSDRLPGDVRLIVVHTPQGSYNSAISTCMNPSADVSYHLLIRRDGTEATQLVPWSRKAWHAKSANSYSDGISVEGYAHLFNLFDPGTKEAAKQVALRLIARNLQPQWTTDPSKGGFCRHGDLQSDRSDPTPDLAEWRGFVDMVQDAHAVLEKPWPVPLPDWVWPWMRWRLGHGEFRDYGPANPDVRPKTPLPVPQWAWKRLEYQISLSRV